MSSPSQSIHIVFIPLLAQGHMIPMVDMARIFSLRGAVQNNHRSIRQTRNANPACVEIPFPCEEVGLPIGFENLDILPSPELLTKFYNALGKLQEPIEKHLREQTPAPSCIISDKYIFWSSETAQRFGVPRFVFHAMCCFSVLSAHNLKQFNCSDSITSDMEPLEVPGMPKGFKITKAQLPGNSVRRQDFEVFRGKIQEAEMAAQGVVVNSFDELEHGCIEAYQKAIGKRIWSIGPVSLCNKDESDMFQRGNKASSDSEKCMAWLDSMRPRSVIYACLGSLCRLVPSQLMELGRGLGASQQPFVWVIKREEGDSELENWLMEERFEERINGRGIVIRGWAPQFVNEALVVDILKIGVRVGVKVPVRWGGGKEGWYLGEGR
ncbi:hypothetical protein NL676_018106 [Syzygium grande]|nr:hypothetical protein NL676_018106 [Syzygium grande]